MLFIPQVLNIKINGLANEMRYGYFSFHMIKNITCSYDGLVAINDDALATTTLAYYV